VQNSLETLRWLAFFPDFSSEVRESCAGDRPNIVYTCYVVFWIPYEGFAEGTSCSMVKPLCGGEISRRTNRGASS